MSGIDEFKSLYKDIRPTLYNNFIIFSKSLKVLSDVDIAIKETTTSYFEDCMEDETDQTYFEVFEFLNLSNLSAYKQLSNIDINRIKKDQYGFIDCFEGLKILITYLTGKSDVIDDKMFNNLLSKQREISCKDYITQEKYLDDIKNVKELLTKEGKVKYNEKILDIIDSDSYFSSIIKSQLHIVKKRYSYIMDGAFGIDDYKGIYTCQDKGSFVGVSSVNDVKILEPDKDLSEAYHQELQNILRVVPAHIYSQSGEDISTTGRQFDKDLIFKASNDGELGGKAIYFPFKMLEIIAKCEQTREAQMLNYRKLSISDVKTKESYIDGLIHGQKRSNGSTTKGLDYEMLEFVYICISNYIRGKEHLNGEELDNKIIEILKSKDVDYYESLKENVQTKLAYYTKCITTAIVMEKLEVGNEKTIRGSHKVILDFRIKINAELGIKNDYGNGDFVNSIREFYGKTKAEFSDIDTSSVAIQDEDDSSMYRLDVFYTFNAEKVNARPVFAYKALQVLQDRGQKLDWNNILLGKSISNNLVTSQPKGTINLQDHKCHFIYAGSRSGKGVMGYNIFATAIASGKPIFYLDAKPDTATVLKALNENIFAFNGGKVAQYDDVMDYNRVFDPNKYNFNIPSYVKALGLDEDILNMAYFKAAYLYFSLFYYLDRCSGKHKDFLAEKLDTGAILVLDEFTEYLNDFCDDKKPWAADGPIFKEALTSQAIQNFVKAARKEKNKIKSSIKKEQNKGEKADESKIQDLSQDYNSVAKESNLTILNLYATSVAEYYKELLETCSSLSNKSGANWNKLQVFVIGQDLSKISSALKATKTGSKDAADWFNQSSTGQKLFITSRGIIPFVHVLKYLKPDFILGYQPDRGTYLAQNSDPRIKANINGSKRCFAYKSCSNLSANDIDAMMDSVENYRLTGSTSLKEYLDNWHIFKPFLILNNSTTPFDEYPDNAEEDIINLMNNNSFDSESKKAICSGKAPINGKVYIKSQYINQTIYYSGLAGITWNDIVADNPPSAEDNEPDDGKHINRGVGFANYIQRLGGNEVIDGMKLSGEIVNYFVKNVYGYNGTWEDYICDFRPEWFIKFSDFNADGTVKSVKERLSTTFFNQNLLDNDFVEIFGDETESLRQYYNIDDNTEGVKNFMQADYDYDEEPEEISDTENSMQTGYGYDEPQHQVSFNSEEPVDRDAALASFQSYEDIYGNGSNTAPQNNTSEKPVITFSEVIELIEELYPNRSFLPREFLPIFRYVKDSVGDCEFIID